MAAPEEVIQLYVGAMRMAVTALEPHPNDPGPGLSLVAARAGDAEELPT